MSDEARTGMTQDLDAIVEYLYECQRDIREEIKMRIEQRDKYSVQLTVALAAIVAIAAATVRVTEGGSVTILPHRVLLAAPLVSIYFTTLILYSYRIHRVLTDYLYQEVEPRLLEYMRLHEAMEPRLVEGVRLSERVGWETYYRHYQKLYLPGIRRGFFVGALWVVSIVSPAIVIYLDWGNQEYVTLVAVLGLIYLSATLWITLRFR